MSTKSAKAPGRYAVNVFNAGSYRQTEHPSDGTYDSMKDAFNAAQFALAQQGVATVIVKDSNPGAFER